MVHCNKIKYLIRISIAAETVKTNHHSINYRTSPELGFVGLGSVVGRLLVGGYDLDDS